MFSLLPLLPFFLFYLLLPSPLFHLPLISATSASNYHVFLTGQRFFESLFAFIAFYLLLPSLFSYLLSPLFPLLLPSSIFPLPSFAPLSLPPTPYSCYFQNELTGRYPLTR